MHPHQAQDVDTLPGISAVLAAGAGPAADLDGVVLDLAAVLHGLVYGNFEIIVVETTSNPAVIEAVATLRVRYPTLPLRALGGTYAAEAAALAAGFDAAAFDLILVAGTTGEFDVRETNHLLEGIEGGADLAIGYRPRRADGMLRRLYGWAWNALVGVTFGQTGRDVDCSFKLFRTVVWQRVRVHAREGSPTFNTELLVRARRQGFRVAEVPVSHHRPVDGATCGTARPTEIRRALFELGALRRGLGRERPQAAEIAVPAGREAA